MTSQKAGEIKMVRDDPHICIQLNGRWQYQRLNKLSQANFKKHRTTISKNVHNLLTKLDIARGNVDIEILGVSSTNSGNIINNTWKEDPSKRAENEQRLFITPVLFIGYIVLHEIQAYTKLSINGGLVLKKI